MGKKKIALVTAADAAFNPLENHPHFRWVILCAYLPSARRTMKSWEALFIGQPQGTKDMPLAIYPRHFSGLHVIRHNTMRP